jgi:DNA-binding PadR family transcriptional regulator
MHRNLSLNTREKVVLYLLRPTRESAYDGEESGPWNTQEGIAEGAAIPIKHVSDALRALEIEGLVRRAKNVHVTGGRRVRRTYLLSESGVARAGELVLKYREREVRVVTPEGEVETKRVGNLLQGEMDFTRYRDFIGALDRWDRFDQREP